MTHQPPEAPVNMTIPGALSYELYRAVFEYFDGQQQAQPHERDTVKLRAQHARYERVIAAHDAIAEWLRGEYGEDADEVDDDTTMSETHQRSIEERVTELECGPARPIDVIDIHVTAIETQLRQLLKVVRELKREIRPHRENDRGLFEDGAKTGRIDQLETAIRGILAETRNQGGVGHIRALLQNALEGR